MTHLAQLFTAQVARTPDAVALVCGSTEVSYVDLDALATARARQLGTRTGDLVAVLVPRSIEFVVEILAVLKAGAAYVPLDPGWPRQRVELILADIDGVRADGLAQVMYTSGSTGSPKGVMLTHDNVAAMALDPCWSKQERVLALASVAFDASTFEIWMPLLTGGTIVLAPSGPPDLATLAGEIGRHRITSLFLTAALFDVVAHENPECLAGVREVVTGGDVVSPVAARRVLDACPGIVIYNAYGPTENTVFATRSRVTGAPGPIPIGTPVSGVEAHVLDASGEPAEEGELWIGGPRVARGYLNQPELTAQRFVNGRYRTGDLVRRRPDGALDFLGRADRQVKIRGFRVELGEVEAALAEFGQNTVLHRDGRLVAYLVPNSSRDVRRELAATLPDFLVPQVIVELDRLPLTASGKVDRDALPAPVSGVPEGAPRTPAEELLCRMAADVLDVPVVGVHDNLFELGGDSIVALRLASRACRLGMAVTVRNVFDHPSVASLARQVRPVEGGAEVAFGAALPLTPLQKGLYFHALLDPDSYVVRLEIDLGPVDEERLRAAVEQLVARHAVLRTGFRAGPVQFVQDEVEVPWGGECPAFVLDAPPLLHCRLGNGRLEDKLVFTFHHLLLDGWSVSVLLRELVALYEGRELPPPADFRAHLAWLATVDQRPAEEAWRRALAGLDGPTFVATRDGLAPHEAIEADFSLHHKGITLNTVVQVMWAVLLGVLTGRDDVVFGTTVSGRSPEVPGVEDIVGPLINTVPVRVRLEPDETVLQLLHRVQAEQTELLPHQHFGLAETQRFAGPLFDTVTVLENFPREVEFESFDAPHYPLALAVRPDGRMRLTYRPDLFTRAEAERILRRLRRIAAADPGERVRDIDVLDPAEHALFASVNDTARPVPQLPFADLFAAQAKRTPAAPALASPAGELTYAELDEQVNRVAHMLIARGVSVGDRVALTMRRSPEMVVAMLAVTRVGAAFVPVDPDYPAERIKVLLADSEPKLVLDSVDATGFPSMPPEVAAPPEVGVPLDTTAYVIYTSGSTGRPKGVEVTHRGLASLAAAQVSGPGDRVLQWASPSFDAAVWEVCGALLTGATLVVAEGGLRDVLVRNRITCVTLPPSLLAELPDDAIPLGVTLVVAGEECPAPVAARWAPGRLMINAYGPTETTVCATTSDPLDGSGSPPIGRPIPNTRVHVLDSWFRPVPIGVAGELYVSGSGVAKGYLDWPTLTAHRFLPGGLYHTGDLVRWRPDGQLEFAGRVDDQLKVRGFRVEPGEVESALAAHPGVSACAVVSSGTGLTAFFSGDAVPAALRAHLAAVLPAHLVPSVCRHVDELPRTPSGKLDRKALTELARRRPVTFAAPGTSLEQRIAALWCALLGVERVGTGDNFYDLGGDSLLMVRMQAELTPVAGREVPLADLHAHPTVAELARHLSGGDDRIARARERAATQRAARSGRIRRELHGRP